MRRTYRSWGAVLGTALLSLLAGVPLAETQGQTQSEKTGPQNSKGGRVYGTVTRIGKDGLSVKGIVDPPFTPATKGSWTCS